MGELFRFWIVKNLSELAFAGIFLAIFAVVFLVCLLIIVVKDKRDKERKQKEE